MPLLTANLHAYSYCNCHILRCRLYTPLSSHMLHFRLRVYTDNHKPCIHRFSNHVLHLSILPYHSNHMPAYEFFLSVPILTFHCDLPYLYLYTPCRRFRKSHLLYMLLLLRCVHIHNHMFHKHHLSTYDFLVLSSLYRSNHISFHVLLLSVSIFPHPNDCLHLFLHIHYGRYRKPLSAYRLLLRLYEYNRIHIPCSVHSPRYDLLY